MEGQSSTSDRRDIPWSLIILGAVALYAVLIVLLNREEVDIDFVFFSGRISKLVLILLCLGLGFAGGYFFANWRQRRKVTAP
jgi:type VI protein secretion system component VasF